MKIADTLELPINAVTQTFSQIGRKGAGKTYLASMIAEQMLDTTAQVIVIDPIGSWWGLRVNKDGKSKGKNIFIIGGMHKDVPLSSDAGKEIAKLLTEKNISVVLDISEFRKNERKKFVTDFAEEFYHLKKSNPTPVHIFLEEAQKFCPQRVQKDEARMLGAWEDIVRLGRNYGIGCSMISQRPQSINKEVFSQVECMFVLQVTGLHERKALEDWVQEAGADRKIIGELPGLHTGEGYVWSPSWLRIFKKVKFNKKTTFDTSATPELGKATKIAKMSKMDVKKLREQMTAVIGKAQQELKEIKDFKQEIRRLNQELQSSKARKQVNEEIINKTAIRSFKDGFKEAQINERRDIQKITHEYLLAEKKIQQLYNVISQVKKVLSNVSKELLVKRELKKTFNLTGNIVGQEKPLGEVKFPLYNSKEITNIAKEKLLSEPLYRDSPISYDSEVKLKAGGIRMLNAIAMFQTISKTRLKTISGISSKGTFGNYLAGLRRLNYIQADGNMLTITQEGISFVGEPEIFPHDTESLVNLWSKHLKSGAIRMLRICINIYPDSISKTELKEEVGIESKGTFGNYLAGLRKNELVKIDDSQVTATKELFE